MRSTLQVQIEQNVPFMGIREELWLNLSRTAAAMSHHMEQALRPFGLSPTQYNVLRILRGAGAEGLCQFEIGQRLVAQVPDVPRILDRMEKAGWVGRLRGTVDRRTVRTTLSEAGCKLLAELDEPVAQAMDAMFPQMEQGGMERLNELLVAARRGAVVVEEMVDRRLE